MITMKRRRNALHLYIRNLLIFQWDRLEQRSLENLETPGPGETPPILHKAVGVGRQQIKNTKPSLRPGGTVLEAQCITKAD